MTNEDYEKTNEELKEEISKNNKHIFISDERTRMANESRFENKFGRTIALSLLPYLGFYLIFAFSGQMPSIISILPVESVPLIITGGSLCIGNIARKIFESKFKIKERLRAFTNAKTENEKIEEEMKYAIELEKKQNRNLAIQKSLDLLRVKYSMNNSHSNINSTVDKNLPQTKEETKKEVEELSNTLNKKYNELDVLSTQKVLHDKFYNIRLKNHHAIDILASTITGGTLAMTAVDFPLVMMFASGMNIVPSLTGALIAFLSPFAVSSIGIGGYMIKRNKDYKNVFNKLNNTLNEDALPEKVKESCVEKQDIDTKLYSKIIEISITNIKLQEQKRNMEALGSSSDQLELEPTVSKKLSKEIPFDNIEFENQIDEDSSLTLKLQ